MPFIRSKVTRIVQPYDTWEHIRRWLTNRGSVADIEVRATPDDDWQDAARHPETAGLFATDAMHTEQPMPEPQTYSADPPPDPLARTPIPETVIASVQEREREPLIKAPVVRPAAPSPTLFTKAWEFTRSALKQLLVGTWMLLGLAVKGLLVAAWYLLRLALRRFSKLPLRHQGALVGVAIIGILVWPGTERPVAPGRPTVEPALRSASDYSGLSETQQIDNFEAAPLNGGNSIYASDDGVYSADGQAGSETEGEVTETLYEASFDCQLTTLSQTELAICRNPELSELDRTLAQIWSNLGPYTPDQLVQQREWLAGRNLCRSNANCLNTLYASRISQLREGTLKAQDEWHGIPAPAYLGPNELEAWKELLIVDYQPAQATDTKRLDSRAIYAMPSSTSRLLVTRIPYNESVVVSHVLQVSGQTWCQLSGRREGFSACTLEASEAAPPVEQSRLQQGTTADLNTAPHVSPSADIARTQAPPFDTAAASDRDARPIRPPAPSYPARAQARGVSGSCDVRFDVNPRGKPYNVVATCSDSVFKAEAERAVSKVEFAPKIVSGKPVERRNVVYPLEFTIE